MRISDWSSDVCSSDLPAQPCGAVEQEEGVVEAGVATLVDIVERAADIHIGGKVLGRGEFADRVAIEVGDAYRAQRAILRRDRQRQFERARVELQRTSQSLEGGEGSEAVLCRHAGKPGKRMRDRGVVKRGG